jgi:hypothetical protein
VGNARSIGICRRMRGGTSPVSRSGERPLCSDEDLMAAKNACWEEVRANNRDFPDERANQYRAAIFAVESRPMQASDLAHEGLDQGAVMEHHRGC